MLLAGMVASALSFGALLSHFSEVRLIQVIQGAGLLTMVLNITALWKQEARDPAATAKDREQPSFRESWQTFSSQGQAKRRLISVGLGTVAFSMQDILLEPYGGKVLNLTVGQTTALTALLACGGLGGFLIAARWLGRGADPYRFAAFGVLTGLVAFACVIFAAPMSAAPLFALGVVLIGFGAGIFAHCTLTAAMGIAPRGQIGLVLGVWGAVQASAAGGAAALGGITHDTIAALAQRGVLGPALSDASIGYSFVYHIEIALLFATLIALGPLVRPAKSTQQQVSGFTLSGLSGKAC